MVLESSDVGLAVTTRDRALATAAITNGDLDPQRKDQARIKQRIGEHRVKAFSIFVFEFNAQRLANFGDGNERQHGKDRKSYHHRATPDVCPCLDCMAAANAFRAQTVSIRLEV
jgi:hypothetical protein